jgi:glutathione peroxidase
LQELHEAYSKKGLAVLGFPCNQFGNQEPGDNAQIKAFCTAKYNVTFDMFSKINVNGEDACGLYAYLTKVDSKPKGAGNVSWNFEKFVLGRDGKVMGRFPPQVKPDDPKIVALIKAEMAE